MTMALQTKFMLFLGSEASKFGAKALILSHSRSGPPRPFHLRHRCCPPWWGTLEIYSRNHRMPKCYGPKVCTGFCNCCSCEVSLGEHQWSNTVSPWWCLSFQGRSTAEKPLIIWSRLMRVIGLGIERWRYRTLLARDEIPAVKTLADLGQSGMTQSIR